VKRYPAEFNEEQFALYEKYVNFRHPNGGMDNPEPREYMEMLTCQWTKTSFIEFRQGSQLVAVAVMDELDDGYSAVYTYFDPYLSRRLSLGTYAILWQIQETYEQNLEYLYLGYLIDDCPKMSYKRNFSPLEQFVDNRWERIE
jgi:arginine-tRNA-protein transferase